jgi:hypothetical protein
MVDMPDLDLWAWGAEFPGGLAFFLLGMGRMAKALKSAAGDRLRAGLARLTTNRFTGALTGAVMTPMRPATARLRSSCREGVLVCSRALCEDKQTRFDGPGEFGQL